MMRKCLFKFVAVAMMAATVISCSSDDDSEPTAFGKGTATAKIAGVKRKVNWVQLWQDGPRFAEFNVGATAIYEYGGYYAWGGLYNQSDDYYTSIGPLPADRDVATQHWGSNWRMPTKAEMKALINNCVTTWTYNYQSTGKAGRVFTGKGDYAENSIFLPAAGSWTTYGGFEAIGGDVCYWTSDSKESLTESYDKSFYQGYALASRNYNYKINDYYPDCCYSVRAVLK